MIIRFLGTGLGAGAGINCFLLGVVCLACFFCLTKFLHAENTFAMRVCLQKAFEHVNAKKCVFGVPDQVQHKLTIQPQKMARGLKFRF